MSDFEKSVTYAIQNEGGYTDDPNDLGGATNWGVTENNLSEFRGYTVSKTDVKNMTIDEAKEVYKKFFWTPLKLDLLVSSAISTAILDVAINRGNHASSQYAQMVSGASPDGILGSQTIAALNAMKPNQFLLKFIPLVQNGYISLVEKNNSQLWFLKGWLARSQRLLTLLEDV